MQAYPVDNISHLAGPRSMGILTRTAPRRADSTRKRLLPFREPSFVPSQAGHTYSISYANKNISKY